MPIPDTFFADLGRALPYQRVARNAARLCTILLAILSLIPGNMQVRSGMPGGIEHTLAYFGTATLFMLGYDRKGWKIAVGLAAYSGLLEILQLLVPGRTANFADMLASGSGAVLGAILWAVLLKQGAQQSPIHSPPPDPARQNEA